MAADARPRSSPRSPTRRRSASSPAATTPPSSTPTSTSRATALPDTSGELVTTTGEVVGRHDGIHSFTVGQRKGLGLSSPNPLYVLAIHPDTHHVTVGADADLYSSELVANRLNWISIPELSRSPSASAIKIRHRHEPAQPPSDDWTPNCVQAIFDEPQRAITPGQSAVFYQEDEVARRRLDHQPPPEPLPPQPLIS